MSRHGLLVMLVLVSACTQGPSLALSQTGSGSAASSQLDTLVAPIALYPDPLVAPMRPRWPRPSTSTSISDASC